MFLLLPAFAQTESLLSQSTSGLYRDPIDFAWEPASLGNQDGAYVLGTLAARSPGVGLGTIRPFGPGQLAVWVEGDGANVRSDASATVEGATSGTLEGSTLAGGQLWLAWGNGRAGVALGTRGAYDGATATARFYDTPTLGESPYDDDTDTGLYSSVFLSQDLVIGFLLGDTEIDLLYRYEMARPYVAASLTQANQRFETKGMWEESTFVDNHMGHGGGVRLDSTIDDSLRVLVEVRVGAWQPSSASLIDILEIEGATVYRRDLERIDARAVNAEATALVARHHKLDRVELRYGVSLFAWTTAGGWKERTTLYQGDESTVTDQEHLGRWSALSLGLPAAAWVPVNDRLSLFVGGNAGFTSRTSTQSFLVTGGDGEDQNAVLNGTHGQATVGMRFTPSPQLNLDLATTNLDSLAVSGVWRF